jgi:hypothetical protein
MAVLSELEKVSRARARRVVRRGASCGQCHRRRAVPAGVGKERAQGAFAGRGVRGVLLPRDPRAASDGRRFCALWVWAAVAREIASVWHRGGRPARRRGRGRCGRLPPTPLRSAQDGGPRPAFPVGRAPRPHGSLARGIGRLRQGEHQARAAADRRCRRCRWRCWRGSLAARPPPAEGRLRGGGGEHGRRASRLESAAAGRRWIGTPQEKTRGRWWDSPALKKRRRHAICPPHPPAFSHAKQWASWVQ